MKRTAIISVILLISCVLVVGCTGTRSNPDKSPTQGPSSAAILPTPSASIGPGGSTALGIDESMLYITGEADESLPEDSIPTPDAS